LNSIIEIYSLVDNYVTHPRYSARRLMGEHGLSFLIRYRGKSYLFDTGPGFTLKQNLNALKFDVNNLDSVILSHSHWDHTGGLEEILKMTGGINVIVHPHIFADKYIKKGEEEVRKSGLTRDSNYFVQMGAQLKFRQENMRIDNDFYLLGPVTPQFAFDDGDMKNRVIKGKDGKYYPDDFKDEQYLCINTDRGLVLILGCTHMGLKNTVFHAMESMEETRVYAILGGLHLFKAHKEHLKEMARWLNNLGVQVLVGAHCTGFETMAYLKQVLNAKVEFNYVGLKNTILKYCD